MTGRPRHASIRRIQRYGPPLVLLVVGWWLWRGEVTAGRPARMVLEEQRFGEYVVRFLGNRALRPDYSDEGYPRSSVRCEILYRGRCVWERECWWGLWLPGSSGMFDYDVRRRNTGTVLPMGQDINGDGQPELVIFESGGQADHRAFVFQIGDHFCKLATLELGKSDLRLTDPRRFVLRDMDGDRCLEAVLDDWTCGWGTCGAAAAAVEVILRWRDGCYQPATDLMRKPPPSPDELRRRAKQIRAKWPAQHRPYGPTDLPGDLWREVLDLIYSGNAAAAWRFVDMVWPPGEPGKEALLAQFRRDLARSPCWPAIREMNGLGDDGRPGG
ncbi:MAG: hypothetical protein HY321_06915 [Armatimonadetes bacterium]|nr:hypothetical protein [Armatimonadota bacterium]